jgi:hypothetical protein
MGTAAIEVSGSDPAGAAAQLQAALAAAVGRGERVSAVEVHRSAEVVVAVISLAFSGVTTAKTLWDWAHPKAQAGVRVRVVWGDGTQTAVADVDQQQLEIEFDRHADSDG